MSIQIQFANSDQDWEAMKEICCLTGLSGDPIDPVRCPFFSKQWVGPYQKIKSLNYIATEDESPEVLGYLTSAPDTLWFEKKRKMLFDLPLVLEVISGKYPANSDTRRFLKRFFKLGKGPEQSFPDYFLKNLKKDYPAHLHMNVKAQARGKKIGAKLVERLKKDLLEKNIHGVHLFCGEGPIGFYQKQGFVVLHRIEFRPQVPVYALGVRF